MPRYSVQRIDGLPPIKDGANSMWGKPEQIPRLQQLRRAFLGTLAGRPPLSANIRLTVRVHIQVNSKGTGDLDNFITGICDGLQRGNGEWPAWNAPEFDSIHPRVAVAIQDDYQVVAIDAQKVIEPGHPWYSVEIEGD